MLPEHRLGDNRHSSHQLIFRHTFRIAMSETLLITASSAVLLVTMAFLVVRLGMLSAMVRALLGQQARLMEEKHREMLKDLHEGLANHGDRLS